MLNSTADIRYVLSRHSGYAYPFGDGFFAPERELKRSREYSRISLRLGPSKQLPQLVNSSIEKATKGGYVLEEVEDGEAVLATSSD